MKVSVTLGLFALISLATAQPVERAQNNTLEYRSAKPRQDCDEIPKCHDRELAVARINCPMDCMKAPCEKYYCPHEYQYKICGTNTDICVDVFKIKAEGLGKNMGRDAYWLDHNHPDSLVVPGRGYGGPNHWHDDIDLKTNQPL